MEQRCQLLIVGLLSVILLCAGGSIPTHLHAQSQDSITVSIDLDQGWNLSSIPVQADDQSFGALLPPCQSGFFFEPGTGYSTIGDNDSVSPGKGVFGKCSASTVQITGTPPDSSSIAVDRGWNVIGALADTISADSVSSDPGGIIQTSFFGFQRGYQAADSLYPGRGYWVKVSQQGELDLSTLDVPPPPPPSSKSPADPSTETLRLTISDARGRSATLHFLGSPSTSRLQEFERPPKPPGDLFDVRFASGYVAASLGERNRTEPGTTSLPDVELQGLKFPAEVRLEGALSERTIRLSTRTGRTATLTAQRRAVSLFESTDRLQLALQGVPTAFALGKSRPHPVARRAIIEYAVAAQTEVSIEVFDALGRRVMQLVDDRKQAGVHRVRVAADRLSSGTYFVRMQAGTFRKTRRLTVIR